MEALVAIAIGAMSASGTGYADNGLPQLELADTLVEVVRNYVPSLKKQGIEEVNNVVAAWFTAAAEQAEAEAENPLPDENEG